MTTPALPANRSAPGLRTRTRAYGARQAVTRTRATLVASASTVKHAEASTSAITALAAAR